MPSRPRSCSTLAEKAGKLIPGDAQDGTRQWCFAAVGTVGTTLACIDLVDVFDSDNAVGKVRAEARKLAGRWLGDVERRLEGREWIACADFTMADMLAAAPDRCREASAFADY